VPGRVLRRRFLGEVDLLEIAVQGLDAPIVARLRGSAGARRGDDVRVAVEEADVLVFPRLTA
jgi:iron(III) transport system ATP-binding protein